MHPLFGDGGLGAPSLTLLLAQGRVLAEFLEAHQRGCTIDQPLLTEAGLLHVYQMLGQEVRSLAEGSRLLPRWDAESRRLWLGERLLKAFRQPAPNQTILLAVFQEQGWVRRIDDPLPRQEGDKEEDAKRRLHDTIKNLNRVLPAGTIRFHGDGTGQGILWDADHH